MHLSGNAPLPSDSGYNAKLPPAAGTTNAQPLSSTPGGFWGGVQNLFTQVVQAAPQLLSISSQQRLANENIRRARAGLPPITWDQVPGLVPTYNVQGGLDQGTQRTVLYLGLALVGGFVLLNVRKRR